jgi:hypothetical protein
MTVFERNLGLQWVIAVVAGWVIGFFLCGVIENRLSTFFIDGLVIGTTIGVAQGLVIRRRIAPMALWVVVSVIGFGIGKFVADLIGQASPSLPAMALGGAVIGLAVGFTQFVILMDQSSRAWWWIAANAVGWAAAWLLIELVPSSSVVMTYAVVALGATVVGVITGIALIGLSRHPIQTNLPTNSDVEQP